MSYPEKRNIVNIISTLLITGIYFSYVLESYNETVMNTDEQLAFWANSLLILIPITIISKIVIHIIFAIANAIVTREMEDDHKSDERDKLIEMKASRNSQYVFILGFLLAMIALSMQMSVTTMFGIIIISGMLAEIFGNIAQLYFYKRGV